MKKNVGTTDKLIRIIAALVLVILHFTGTLSGTIGIIALVFAGVLVLTSLVGFCGLYTVCGMNTCPLKSEKDQ